MSSAALGLARRFASHAALALSISACDGGSTPAPEDDADAVSPSDIAETSSGPADIDLSLPDTGPVDRELRSGQTAWVGHVTDGDTLVVWVGDLAPHSHVIRLVGLAAPECFKEQRSTPDGRGNSCVRDDEIHGLAAFEALRDLVEDKRVTVTCEKAPGEVCPKDTYGRSLAYVTIDGKDAAIEMARGGHALSYVTFYSSKRAQICEGVYDARDAKRGMWALGSETFVIGRMNSDTRSWYWSLHDKRCDEAMGN